jgi:CRISPR-associated protein Csx10
MPDTLRVRFHLKARSPVAFGSRRGTTSSFVDTLDYVPGTALRGATAARYLRELGEASDPRFRDIFLNGGVLFANLYPINEADISYVLPATAYSCKAYREAHGVKDILARAAALRLSRDQINQELLDSILNCSQCRHSAHSIAGFYEKYLGDPIGYALVEVHKRHLMHVGINRRTQAAEKGILFAQQVISEARREDESQDFKPQVFSGDLIVSEEHIEFLLKELLVKEISLKLGESRTRGLGQMAVQKCEIIATDTEEAVRSRIAELNRQLAESMPLPREQSYIALTCQADIVLTDVFMRPKSAPDGSDIHRALRNDQDAGLFAPDGLRLVYANAGTRLVQSWNVASGYPKPDDIATTMGSVFLFEATSDNAEGLVTPLALLQERGIGRRRSEGFGRVTVCDPFHLEVQGQWQAR